MEFSYVAVNNNGQKQKGVIESRSEEDIVEFLKKNNLTPITIKSTAKQNITFLNFGKVNKSDIVLFTRQLSSMLITGLTLLEALNVLKKQARNAEMELLLDDLIANISEGKSFSGALSNHKDIFSSVYISVVNAAETGGLMDKLLEKLADNLEKSEELEKNIKSALFYPAIIVVAMTGVIVIMNIVVVPQLNSLYEGLNVELPLLTRIVVASSKFMVNYWMICLGAVGSLILSYKKFSQTSYGIKLIDKIKMKVPVFGSIVILSSLAQITGTFSLLVKSGTSILDSLEISANVATNVYFKEAILSSRALVEKGISVSTALENQKIFPQMMIQMARVGEETGKMDESIAKVSEYFERDLNLKIKTLTTAIEPILIVILGATVGVLIIAIITPIYGLISKIQ